MKNRFKLSSNLLRFNLKKLFINSGVYIIPIITMLIFCAITLPQMFFSTPNLGKNIIFSITPLSFAGIFVGTLSFLAFVIIQIFKKPQSDGTALVILARNIGRKTMTATNMLTVFISSFYFVVILFFGTLVIVSADKHASEFERFKFAISIAIGSFIIMGIFETIIILYSIFLSERVTLILTILIGIAAPIVSFVVKPMVSHPFTSANLYSKYSVDSKGDLNPNNLYYLNMSEPGYDSSNQGNDYKEYLDKKYRNFVWLDAWYQMSGLYSMFYQSENSTDKVWNKSTTKFEIGSNYSLVLNGQEYGFIAKDTQSPSDDNRFNNLKSVAWSKYIDAIKQYSSQISPLTFEKQIYFSANILSSISSSTSLSQDQINASVAGLIQSLPSKVSTATQPMDPLLELMIYCTQITNIDLKSFEYLSSQDAFAVASTSNLNYLDKTKTLTDAIISPTNPDTQFGPFSANIYPVVNNYNLKVFTSQDYIKVQYLVVLWLSIAVVATLGTFYFYNRMNIY